MFKTGVTLEMSGEEADACVQEAHRRDEEVQPHWAKIRRFVKILAVHLSYPDESLSYRYRIIVVKTILPNHCRIESHSLKTILSHHCRKFFNLQNSIDYRLNPHFDVTVKKQVVNRARAAGALGASSGRRKN